MTGKDQVFISQINSKKIPAFKELFDMYYNSLVLFAVKYVKRQDAAEDIVQELLVYIWERGPSFSSFIGLKTFLYTSVRNNCMDYLKHKNVEQRYATSFSSNSDNDDLDDKVMKEELYRMLVEAINKLPRRCRKVFELHMCNKKNKEIAQELQLSVLTVKTQKKRAVHHLKELLGDNFSIIFLIFLYPLLMVK